MSTSQRSNKLAIGGSLARLKPTGATAPVMADGTQTYVPGISSNAGSTTIYDHHDLIGSAGLRTNEGQRDGG